MFCMCVGIRFYIIGSRLDIDLIFVISILISVKICKMKSVSDRVLNNSASNQYRSVIFSLLQFNNNIFDTLVIITKSSVVILILPISVIYIILFLKYQLINMRYIFQT